MATLTYRAKVDLGVTLACLLVGGFFTFLSLKIEPETEQLIGSRTVPLFLSVMVMALGVLIAVFALINGRNGNGAADADEIPPEDEFGFADSDVIRVFQVIGSGGVYIAAFWAFGYLLSSVIALALMLLTFGNRNLRVLVLMPLIGVTIYQFVFMGLMGLHDPTGVLLDLKPLSNLISGN